MKKVWRDQGTRDAALQAVFLAALLGLVLAAILVTRANFERLGLASGFGFLFETTGWDIGFSLLDYTATDPYWRVLLVGVLNTLFLGIIGLALATIVGLSVGMARTSANDLARLLGALYVETFRNVPLIVQVFFWYAVITRFPGPRQALNYGDVVFLSSRGLYLPGLNVTGLSAFLAIAAFLLAIGLVVWIGMAQRFSRAEPAVRARLRLAVLAPALVAIIALLWWGHIPDTALVSIPALTGLNFSGGLQVPPELAALAVSIAIYGGAYIGEIVRGGFKAVGKGQIEAARSMGLTPFQTFRTVRFPLALRAMMPILTNQYVWLIKATTMGIAIGFADFFMIVSISINQSGHTMELIAILMGGFLIINFTLAALLNRFNRAIALESDRLRG